MARSKKNIPKLRFKDFDSEWTISQLQDCVDDLSSGVSVNSEDKPVSGDEDYGILKTSCVSHGIFIETENKRITQEVELKRARLNPMEGHIIVSRMNTPLLVGESGYVHKDFDHLFVPDRLWALKVTPKVSSKWLSYFLITERTRSILTSMATGTSGSMKNISQPNFLGITLSIPEKREQQKIASFLSLVDAKIQQLIKKKELLEQYKKGVMQKIFKREIRFKDERGKSYQKWEEKKLSEVLLEHKTKSTGREEVFSVSVHKGLVNQIEHLGRSFAAQSTDHYNLVKPNDIVYTKSPTGDFPYGIIKQSWANKNVIVSPLYGVFTPETPELGYMLNVYFEFVINAYNYLHSIIQKGAKNTINITNETFLSKKLKLPPSQEEQRRIGSFLREIDSKINQVNSQIGAVKKLKKGLLQQMFV